jgi:hypothetical protein
VHRFIESLAVPWKIDSDAANSGSNKPQIAA